MKRFTDSWLVRLPSAAGVVGVSLLTLLAFHAVPSFADKGDDQVSPVAVRTGLGTVKGDRVNVRSRPSTTAEVVAQLQKGDQVEVRGTQTVTQGGKTRDWLQIVLPANARCFVSAKHLSDGAATVNDLYVRCGPGSNYRDVGKLSQGDRVTVVKTEGEWTQIQPTPACTGWVAAEWVELAPAAPVDVAPPVSEIVPMPVAPPEVAVAPPAGRVEVVSTDPDVHVVYAVRDGILRPTDETEAVAPWQLMTPEQSRLQHRICYFEAPPDTELERYANKHVRVTGNLRWHKGDRYPILACDRIDRVW